MARDEAVAVKRMAVLKQRAAALAKPVVEGAQGPGVAVSTLLFCLAGETYAIETAFIREVYPFKDCTPLPCVPDHVVGLINIRRKILAVIDIRPLFGMAAALSADQEVVVIAGDETEFALLADSVVGLRSVSLEAVQDIPATLTGVRQDLLKGVTVEGVVVLDGVKLLRSPLLIVNEQVDR